MKEKLISILQIIGIVLWGLSVLMGAVLGYDGSIILGVIGGFAVGTAIGTLFYMLGNIIKKPYLLLSFLIIPIGYYFGDGFGVFIGCFLTFAVLLKFHDQEF